MGPASGDVTIVQVGDIVARCPDCGCHLFRRAGGGEAKELADAAYRCAACSKAVSRLELVNQIGDEATRRAREALSALRDKGDGNKRR